MLSAFGQLYHPTVDLDGHTYTFSYVKHIGIDASWSLPFVSCGMCWENVTLMLLLRDWEWVLQLRWVLNASEVSIAIPTISSMC